jgi:hypothetical protein
MKTMIKCANCGRMVPVRIPAKTATYSSGVKAIGTLPLFHYLTKEMGSSLLLRAPIKTGKK